MERATERWMLAGALPVALALGVGASWYLNLPPTPWMEFTSLGASYQPGRPAITTEGRYEVNTPCDPDAVIWRIEAIATDGQVANYGPKKPQPSLTEGPHWYDSSIPLEEEIYPDGWTVRILVTCPGRDPETIASEPALVNIEDVGSSP